jgi:hypothetical protein
MRSGGQQITAFTSGVIFVTALLVLFDGRLQTFAQAREVKIESVSAVPVASGDEITFRT